MNALAIYEPQARPIIQVVPKLDPETIIFLRAFIGTSSPMKVLQVGNNVIPFPMAFPRETRYTMRRYKRSQPAKTPAVIHLPAPTHSLIGKTIHVMGVHPSCKIEAVFERFGDTWAQLNHPFGVTYRKLSDLEV